MQSAESLKRKIGTTTDLAMVVRTMKTLAAVNIRQFEAAAASLGEYEKTIQSALEMLQWHDSEFFQHKTIAVKPRTGMIVFGSDQGMCGGFNDNIAQFVALQLRQCSPGQAVPLIVMGRRLATHLAKYAAAIDDSIELPSSVAGITPMLQDLLPHIDEWRHENRLGEVLVCHNQRVSPTQYEPVQRTLLPISGNEYLSQRPRRWLGHSLPFIPLPSADFWQSVARQILYVTLFHACTESLASENAARIAAMQAAETHIHDCLLALNSDYQQTRQTSITAELLDIVTGFEAINESDRSLKSSVIC